MNPILKEKNSKAYLYSIRLLSRQDYSEYKLTKKLKTSGFSEVEIENAITKAKEKGYLTENNYAQLRIKGFMNKNYSMRYIQQKLKQEYVNISIELIDSIYKEHGLTEEQQIMNLIEKKSRTLTSDNKTVDFKKKCKQKLLSYLGCKGHNPANSLQIVNQHLNHI